MATTFGNLDNSAETARGERFYWTLALVMAGIVFLGFSMQWLMGRSTFAAPLRVHAHAISFMGWVVIFLAQARFATHGPIALHRRLGWLSALWVPLMVVLALAMNPLFQSFFKADGNTQVGGSGEDFTNVLNVLLPESQRSNAFTYFDYDVSDNLNIQVPSTAWQMEAEWTPDGAYCIQHTRWGTADSATTAGLTDLQYVQTYCPGRLAVNEAGCNNDSASSFYKNNGFGLTDQKQRSILRNQSYQH